MILFVVIVKAVEVVSAKVPNRYVRGGVGGATVGLIAVALPLTVGAGNDQLSTVIDQSASISAWLLVAVLLGKMVAMAVSLAAGFIGGNVLPMLFVGGTAGVIIHLLIPDIPYAIAVGSMLAAVPGATIKAPIGLTFIAVLAVGLGPLTAAPVAIAVATASVDRRGCLADPLTPGRGSPAACLISGLRRSRPVSCPVGRGAAPDASRSRPRCCRGHGRGRRGRRSRRVPALPPPAA